MSILTTILLIVVVVLVFNFVIFIHELGHFLAAKWRGMQVDRFQIWFGKPILKKTIGGVQYGIGTIPLGGFVSLPDMAPMESIEGKKLNDAPKKKITPLDKIIVAFAGPLFSVLLAVAAAFVVSQVGKIELPVTSTEIGYVKPDSPAEKAGFLAGDTILEIQGQTPASFNGKFDAVTTMIALSEGEEIDILVQRPGVPEPMTITTGYSIPETSMFQRRAMRRIGIGAKEEVFVGSVMAHSPAAQAGLLEGDKITAVNGQTIMSTVAIMDATKDSNAPVSYTIQRDDKTLEVTIQPEFPDTPTDYDRRLIGINFAYDRGEQLSTVYPSIRAQLKEASTIMLVSIQKVASPKTSLDIQHFSGPVGIGKSMFDTLRIPDGWKELVWFLVILNINLAIFNLMPFPVLDGGHIVLAIVEWVRGKTVELKLLEYIQTGFVLLLFSLFIFVTMKDFGDLLTPKEKPQEVKFLPTSE